MMLGLLVALPLMLSASDSAVACGRAHARHTPVINVRADHSMGTVAVLVHRYSPTTRSSANKRSHSASLHPVVAAPSSAVPGRLRRDPSIAMASTSAREPPPPISPQIMTVNGWLSVPIGKTELVSGLPLSQSCGHVGGCGCCQANGACCGMACCAAALIASAPTLPSTHDYAWTERPPQLSQITYSDTLFRPPCLGA
jgi:hypothetical protein